METVGPPPEAVEQRIRAAYSAFNKRNIDAAIDLMTHDVYWPMGLDRGFLYGPSQVRSYWTRHWKEIHPTVEPVSFIHTVKDETSPFLIVVVEARQIVRDMEMGFVLMDERVGHRFTLEHNANRGCLIRALEICAFPIDD
jgi:hypothetical protein